MRRTLPFHNTSPEYPEANVRHKDFTRRIHDKIDRLPWAAGDLGVMYDLVDLSPMEVSGDEFFFLVRDEIIAEFYEEEFDVSVEQTHRHHARKSLNMVSGAY